MFKWILLPLLWLFAAIVAMMVLYRMWRGKRVVLRGRFTPRVIRMVVILLVTLGTGVEETPAQPLPRGQRGTPNQKPNLSGLPDELDYAALRYWLYLFPYTANDRANPRPFAYWSAFKKAYSSVVLTNQLPQGKPTDTLHLRYLPVGFQKLIENDLEAIRANKPIPTATLGTLTATLNELEKRGYFDHWLVAYFWRKSALLPSEEAVKLIPRLHRHARITNTLILARAKVKPIGYSPRAWMSKGGPRPAERLALLNAMNDMAKACKTLYPQANLGTWQKDGVALLTLAKDSPKLRVESGESGVAIDPGEEVRVGRLDLLVGEGDQPLELEHAWLGKVRLPGGQKCTVWDLARGLTPDARIRAQKVIKDAILGDEKSAERLEQALPLVHNLLRDELKRTPKAEGSPRMRMILSLFDDAVMPKPKIVTPTLPRDDERTIRPRGR